MLTNKYHRRSIRLAGYDYRAAGAYFVTVCVHRKRPVFGRIVEGKMHLNAYGRIVVEEWERTAAIRAEVELDEFVVMPNHFHAIVFLTHDSAPDTHVGACRRTPLPPHQGVPPHAPTLRAPARNLGALVNAFKGAATRRINAHRAERELAPVVVWQRNYYERIVRDEKEWNDTRRYIIENPLHWDTDSENSEV
jgi:putative transposase